MVLHFESLYHHAWQEKKLRADAERRYELMSARLAEMEAYYKSQIEKRDRDIDNLKELVEIHTGESCQVTALPAKMAKHDDSFLDD